MCGRRTENTVGNYKKIMIKQYIGDKKFYRTVLAIAIPIMLQNGITNFVSLLDNIMIGRVGTLEMTGVAIANQLIFVFNLCIFGALSGAGIFGAQFHGKDDVDGVRNTLRFKFIICLVLVCVGTAVLYFFGEDLITLYLKGEGAAEDAAASLGFGRSYMSIILITFLPYAIAQAYASTLRETGETVLPMAAGIVAVLVNLFFNYVLIYGHFGAPAMGVEGAAIATAISRFAELGIVVAATHLKSAKYTFAKGLFKTLRVPAELRNQILAKGTPLMINEGLWSGGMAMLNQCYSMRGQSIMASINITSTLWNVMSVAFMALGSTVGIIIGHRLGAGDVEGAKSDDKKLIAFSVFSAMIVAGLYALASKFFPLLYNTTDDVRLLAAKFICVGAIFMPFDAFVHASYFTLRAGGKTFITFLFDSVFIWVVSVPVVYVLSRFTPIPIVWLYACCQALQLIKCVIGFILVKKGVWINNIVADEEKTLAE